MSTIFRAAGWGLALLCFTLVAAVTLLPAAGFFPLVVVGTSMEPTISDGSLIVVRPVPAEAVKVGDVITFFAYDRLLTHRVIEVRRETEPAFVTRGDGNIRNDPRLVRPTQVRGRLVTSLPWIGLGYTRLGAGMNALLLLPLVLLLSATLWELLGSAIGPHRRQEFGQAG